MDACFKWCDKNEDNKLDLEEFRTIIQSLFRSDKGKLYEVEEANVREMFSIFDRDKDGFLSKQEFAFCWTRWMKRVINPASAFLVVNVQNDFVSSGEVFKGHPAAEDSQVIIEPINGLLSSVRFEAVFFCLDWHPPDHVCFFDSLKYRKIHPSSPATMEDAKMYDVVLLGSPPKPQKLWPRHCVQNSWGSELHEDLLIPDDVIKLYQGADMEINSRSAFFDEDRKKDLGLNGHLKAKNVTDLFIAGLTYDHTVGRTAMDALELGYRTIVIEDCCKALSPEVEEEVKANIVKNNGSIVPSTQVKAMAEGKDRRPELGYMLALNIKQENS